MKPAADARPSVGSALLEVVRSALDPLLAHRLRGAVTLIALTALLTPFLVSTALFSGVRNAVSVAAAEGADVHVTALRLGRVAPLPPDVLAAIRAVDGVDAAKPRIVLPITLGRADVPALLVGLDVADAAVTAGLRGRLPADGPGHELVLGGGLAHALGLDVGDALPPFYRNDAGERVSTVVGVLDGGPPWRQALVLTSFETANHIARGDGSATDVLVRCRTGYGDTVAQTVGRLSAQAADGAALTLRATPRDHSELTLLDGPVRTHSVFDAHLVLAFAVGIPLLLVTSGVGLAARRREAGLLRALGWSMETLLVRGVAEGVLLAVLGAACSVLLAALWLGPLRGAFLAELYLPGMAELPGAVAPYRLAGTPVLLATGIALVLTLTGGVVSVWRAAVASPAEAMT